MPYSRPYAGGFVDAPSTASAISASALNTIDLGVKTANDKLDGLSGIAATIYPSTTNSYDLGSTSYRWRNLYTQDLNLSNGIGDYTIIEGEEDLFILNNKNGKAFKFALIEVDPSVVPPKSGDAP